MSAGPPGVSSASDRDAVVGERSTTLANAARSVQSRVSGTLAAVLMVSLGIAALAWYYAHALGRPIRARELAQSATNGRAQAEMPLPPLAHIVPPRSPGSSALLDAAPPDNGAPELSLDETSRRSAALDGASVLPSPGAGVEGVRVKTRSELAFERRLSGLVFARDSQSDSPSRVAAAVRPGTDGGGSGGPEHEESAGETRRSGSGGALGALLRPTTTDAAQAQLLPNARFLLPKGAFIDCTLETAIDSTLPGLTTCITAADSFGADGKVVLLERGTKLVGETRGQVQQGQARVFVVWTQARTPGGVEVPLDSPGTDELGRAGLPGDVERHFWQRFGAAMLISLVDGAVQAGVQAANRSGGAVVYAPSGSTDVLTEVLKGTLQIPPTLVKKNGERIQVLVARDIDFRSVYELRTIGANH